MMVRKSLITSETISLGINETKWITTIPRWLYAITFGGFIFGSGYRRRGYFIDATPNHQWEDFDHWPIDIQENVKYNAIHWESYVEKPTGSFRVVLDEYSSYTPDWFKANMLQTYGTIK